MWHVFSAPLSRKRVLNYLQRYIGIVIAYSVDYIVLQASERGGDGEIEGEVRGHGSKEEEAGLQLHP